jgi:hypothetical protein
VQLPIAGLHGSDGRIGIATHGGDGLIVPADIHRAAAIVPDLVHLQT